MTTPNHVGAAIAALEQSLACQRHLTARYLVDKAATALELARRHDLAERLTIACTAIGWPDMVTVEDVLRELDSASA